MPEISLFFDLEDEKALAAHVLVQGGWLVADRQSSPDYTRIQTLEEYTRDRSHERLFFIVFDEYFASPLDIRLIKSGPCAGQHSIMQRSGGPAIDFLTSVEHDKDGYTCISDGDFSYYPTHENTITKEWVKAPDALVKRYRSIVSHLKKSSKLIRGPKSGRKYLVGPHTRERIKRGELRLGVPGLTVD